MSPLTIGLFVVAIALTLEFIREYYKTIWKPRRDSRRRNHAHKGEING